MTIAVQSEGREQSILNDLIACLEDQLQLLRETYQTGFIYENCEDGTESSPRSLTLFELKDIHSVESDLAITLGLLTDLYNNLTVAKTKGMIFWFKASPSFDLSWVNPRLTLNMQDIIDTLDDIADDLAAEEIRSQQHQLEREADAGYTTMDQRLQELDRLLRAAH